MGGENASELPHTIIANTHAKWRKPSGTMKQDSQEALNVSLMCDSFCTRPLSCIQYQY